MRDPNEPKIVYTIPYFTHLKLERLKYYFFGLCGVAVISPIFWMNLALVMAITPKPLMNHILGITPEMERQQAERDVLIDRRERFDKAEAARNQAIAQERKAAYSAEAGANYRAYMAELERHAQADDATARLRAFR